MNKLFQKGLKCRVNFALEALVSWDGYKKLTRPEMFRQRNLKEIKYQSSIDFNYPTNQLIIQSISFLYQLQTKYFRCKHIFIYIFRILIVSYRIVDKLSWLKIVILDGVGEYQHFDADFHIDRPVVRHMLSIEIQVYDSPSKNCYHSDLGDIAAFW